MEGMVIIHPALRIVKPGNNVTTLVGKNPTNWGDGSGYVAGFGEIGGIATTADGKVSVCF